VDVVQGEIDTVKGDIEAKSESGELNAVAVLLTKIAQLEEKRDAVAQALQSEDLDNLDASHYMWCGPCNRLVTHDRFEIWVGAVIMLNVMLMSLEHYDQVGHTAHTPAHTPVHAPARPLIHAVCRLSGSPSGEATLTWHSRLFSFSSF